MQAQAPAAPGERVRQAHYRTAASVSVRKTNARQFARVFLDYIPLEGSGSCPKRCAQRTVFEQRGNTRRRPHDSPRVRVSRSENASGRAGLAESARRRRQAAGRRPQPAADDEAAIRAARAPDRPRQDSGAEGHPRGGRHAAHRRDDHRERADLVEASAAEMPAAGRRRAADLRSAGALQGHDRRGHRARGPRQRPSGADAGARRVVRAEGRGRASASCRPTVSSSAPTTRCCNPARS